MLSFYDFLLFHGGSPEISSPSSLQSEEELPCKNVASCALDRIAVRATENWTTKSTTTVADAKLGLVHSSLKFIHCSSTSHVHAQRIAGGSLLCVCLRHRLRLIRAIDSRFFYSFHSHVSGSGPEFLFNSKESVVFDGPFSSAWSSGLDLSAV